MTTENKLGSPPLQSEDNFRVPEDSELVRERLRAALKAAGGNQVVAAKSGVPISTIGAYLGGKTEIRASALAAIASVCGISLDALYGLGSVDAQPTVIAGINMDCLHINRYELHASAGNGSRQFDLPTAKKWAIQKELLPGFSGKAENLMSTDVMGDSMMPTLRDGEPVIVDRSARFDRDGVYLLTIGDDLYVKRLHKAPGRGGIALHLISDNPAYPEVVIDPDGQETVRVIGRVIWPDTTRRIR